MEHLEQYNPGAARLADTRVFNDTNLIRKSGTSYREGNAAMQSIDIGGHLHRAVSDEFIDAQQTGQSHERSPKMVFIPTTEHSLEKLIETLPLLNTPLEMSPSHGKFLDTPLSFDYV